MLIKNITINYYKSIKEPIDLALQPVNIFIGQNNSGKSNVLDAIEFALANRLTDDNLYYKKSDIELDLIFDDDEQGKYQLPSAEGRFVLKENQRSLFFENKEIKYGKSLALILSSSVKRLNEDAFSDTKQIEIDWQGLFKYPQQMDQFNKYLKKHFPKVSADENAFDINYEHQGLYEGERRVTIDRMGSGFRRIFTILLYVFHPQYSVVMIDEPETHLHPIMIKRLYWAMQNSQAGQIIFTTHSPLFIMPNTLPQLVRVTKQGQLTKAFTISDKEGKYNTQRLLQELNADNLEMFFADKVLLVEGVSDRLLTRGLMDRFYQGQKDIKVVQTHGKGNTYIYIDLLRIFQIPFAILFDNDVIRHDFIRELLYHLDIKLPPMREDELIEALREHEVYIFKKGALEQNYPHKYQTEDSKTLNALKAANLITQQDLDSKAMRDLKEIVTNI